MSKNTFKFFYFQKPRSIGIFIKEIRTTKTLNFNKYNIYLLFYNSNSDLILVNQSIIKCNKCTRLAEYIKNVGIKKVKNRIINKYLIWLLFTIINY